MNPRNLSAIAEFPLERAVIMRTICYSILALLILSPATWAQDNAWADKLFEGKLAHDFGTVSRGEQLKYSFKITNIYKVPLDITEIRLSCDCVKASATKRSLGPKESGTLDVVVETSKFTGPRTVKIFVTVGPKFISTATLVVAMNSRGDIALNPPQLDFGNIQRGQTPTKTVDLEYVGNSPKWQITEILNSASSPYSLKVDVLPPGTNGAARKGFRLIATMKPDAQVGAFKNDITVKTNDRTNPDLVYNVLGNVQERLVITPNRFAISGKVGVEQKKMVFLRSSEPFRVKSIDGLGDGITIDLPKGQEATHVLTVSITPTKAGALNRVLKIHTDLDKDASPLTLEGTIEP